MDILSGLSWLRAEAKEEMNLSEEIIQSLPRVCPISTIGEIRFIIKKYSPPYTAHAEV